MTPAQLDRVFGRGRLQMATGEHVEVFREAVGPGERRRYTKRFLNTRDGNFAHWTEREWRILARLIGHGVDCVPDVVQFDRGSIAGEQLVQTYDAGATVDQWATLLPLIRDGRIYRHAFEDCAHWWALAHHSLIALKKIHQLELVHLDVKGDNVCIPFGPANFDPASPNGAFHPLFDQLALIDFAFALVSGEALASPLPIGWQRDYDYQSPRLLKALEEGRNGDLTLTCALDWRCDMYSLAAMLKRYLPDEGNVHRAAEAGWTAERYDAAKALILALREHHDREIRHGLPHNGLINTTGARLRERDLAASLAAGWTIARDVDVIPTATAPLTPMTRLAPSIRVFVSPRERIARAVAETEGAIALPLIIPRRDDRDVASELVRRPARRRSIMASVAALVVALAAVGAFALFPDLSRSAFDRALASIDDLRHRETVKTATPEPPKPVDETPAQPPPASLPPSAPEPPQQVAETPQAPPQQVAETPQQVAEIPPAPPPRKAVAQSKPTTASPKKTKSAPAPSLAAQSPRPTVPSSAPQRAPSTTVSRYVASLAKATAPATTAALVAPATSTPSTVTVIPSSPPPASPTPAPQIASTATRAEPTDMPSTTDPTRVDEMPMPPPSSQRERSRKSLGEKLADQGWLSRVLQLVKSKPAPIEDRRAQGSPPKTAMVEPVEPPAAPALPPSSPPPVTSTAAPAPPVTSTAAPMPPAFADGDSVFANEGRRVLRDVVPRVATQAQAEIARVLWVAANANDRTEDRTIVEAVQSIHVGDGASSVSPRIAPAEARRLNADASDAFWSGRNAADALEIQLKAFGANPYDAEVVGNLAVLHLKLTRPQAETARQLAMIAIAYRSGRYRAGRVEDWMTYAVASALSGRVADARNALFVTVALSPSIEKSCRSALTALGSYGERMREPVEAMFYRVQAQGRAYESPYCSMPRKWAMAPASGRAFAEK